MTETELINIKRARLALVDKNEQEALDYYLQVKEENDVNFEADFWINAARWKECEDNNESASEKWSAFKSMSTYLSLAIDGIAKTDGIENEKIVTTAYFTYAYLPTVPDVTGILGDDMAPREERVQKAVLGLYWAGNAIERNFNSNQTAMKIACDLWKAGVELQQKFQSFDYNGNNAEDYVEKIKKLIPDYISPKEEREAANKKLARKQAYYSVFVLAYLKMMENDEELKFHVNQGLWLLILEALATVIIMLVPVVGFLIGAALWVVAILLSCKGSKAAVNDKRYVLPIFGKIKLVK